MPKRTERAPSTPSAIDSITPGEYATMLIARCAKCHKTEMMPATKGDVLPQLKQMRMHQVDGKVICDTCHKAQRQRTPYLKWLMTGKEYEDERT